MSKITKLLFSLLAIFIYGEQSHADKREWICSNKSWDCIYSINKEKNSLIFKTSQGIKKYNLETKKWGYVKSNLSLKEHNDKILDRASSFTHLIPGENHNAGFTYQRGIAVDNYEKPTYLIVRGAGEGAAWSENKIFDLKNKITYSLPSQYYQPFRTIYATKNDIWLGSAIGIARITKKIGVEKGGDLAFYETYSGNIPASKLLSHNGRIYFISRYGLVSISQREKSYESFRLINKKYDIDRLLMHRNNIILFAKDKSHEDYYSKPRKISLLFFKVNKSLYRNIKEVKAHNIEATNASYISTVILKNHNMYAYGHTQRWVEGAEYFEHGGSFKYSFTRRRVEEIVSAPVGYLDLKNKLAITRTGDVDGSTTIKVYSLDKKWPITKPSQTYIVYPMINFVRRKMRGKVFKVVSGDRWDGKKIEVTDKKEIKNILSMAKAKYKTPKKEAKTYKVKNLLGEDVYTVKLNRGKVGIQ